MSAVLLILSLAILVLVGGAIVTLVTGVIAYNSLIAKRNDVDNAWSQIDVQLKRRHDLIPNLVETVKGYATHEKSALEAVIRARQGAGNGSGQGAAAQAIAENQLTATLGRLFALQEAYPDLKANENFRDLQEELSSTENRIGFARQHYNDSVGVYRTTKESFPTNFIANMFTFPDRSFFQLSDQEKIAAQTPPSVKF
ncbi:MAG: LemA family protein [Deltaproteobacteria bacterium]|nr:LemA family protein [Deltaproteobacteria bacterium]